MIDKYVILLRKISIRRRLTYAFVILCVIPIFSMILITTLIQAYYYTDNSKMRYEIFAYESEIRINDVFDQLELKVDYLKKNNDILTDLYLYNTSREYQTEVVERRIENTIASIMSTQREIGHTAVVTEDGKVFSHGLVDFDMNNVSDSLNDEDGWSYYEESGSRLLYRIEKVEIDYTSGETVTFFLLIDRNALNQVIKEAVGSTSQKIAIIDQGNRFITGTITNNEDVGYKIIKPISNTNFNIRNSFDKINYDFNGLFIALVLSVLVFAVAGIIMYMVHASIHIPLRYLLARIENFEDELLLITERQPQIMSKDEHAILNNEFTNMLIRLNLLLEETYTTKINEIKLRTRIKELELVSLQQRINPHFFYNLLENVFWMAQMKGYEEIGDMVSALGEFFKTSVSEKGAFVSIKTEIENVRSYVSLQKIMHKNQFEAVWDIDPEIMMDKTVKLVLQPIIENCIVHGFEGIESGGIITISGREKEGDILFEISDNGKGMSDVLCETIKKRMHSSIYSIGDSIGIRNVNQRIKIYYGNEYGLDIKSTLNQGTTVSLRIPKRSQ